MELKKKLDLLEEMMELDEGKLTSETSLEDLEEWDSMAALSFIVLLDEEFNKKITAKEIRAFKTIGDMLSVME
jgi:acyl carrier protein